MGVQLLGFITKVVSLLLAKENICIPVSTIYYNLQLHPKLFKFNDSDAIYKRRKRKEKETQNSGNHCKGVSIEYRCPSIMERKEFGHWEMDTVVSGRNKGKSALLVLTERKTRYELIFKIADKTAESVESAIDVLEFGLGNQFSKIFKTITVDNGVEFINPERLEQSILSPNKKTTAFYCHPYSSWERGSNENNNRFIRRFIPKGSNIDLVDESKIYEIQKHMNHYPRALLGFKSAYECFEQECGFTL